MTAIQLPRPARTAEKISQATAVEQSRAIAEVQAMVVVAQQCPRDMARAEAEMRTACGRMRLADRAFYAVKNRGNGPSVHLARELARIWGNIQYGVHELRRDDDAGESEIQALAWDLQTNTRSVRTFIVPHARMKDGKRLPLTDLGDIYLSNQNIGARAVRECIFTVLPTDFTEEAQDRCKATLEHGEGKPLGERIDEMVRAFAALHITLEQMEAKVGRKRGTWDASVVAQMQVAYTSITRDNIPVDELFPPAAVSAPVTAAEITARRPAPPAEPEPPAADPVVEAPRRTEAQSRKLHATLNGYGITDRAAGLRLVAAIIDHPLESTSELTKDEAKTLIDTLEQMSPEAARAIAAGDDNDAPALEEPPAVGEDPFPVDNGAWPETTPPGGKS